MVLELSLKRWASVYILGGWGKKISDGSGMCKGPFLGWGVGGAERTDCLGPGSSVARTEHGVRRLWWEGRPENQVQVTSWMVLNAQPESLMFSPNLIHSQVPALLFLPRIRNVSSDCLCDVKHNAKSQAWEYHAHEIGSFELSLIACLWVFWLAYLFTFLSGPTLELENQSEY